jgi:hypothetical protein
VIGRLVEGDWGQIGGSAYQHIRDGWIVCNAFAGGVARAGRSLKPTR